MKKTYETPEIEVILFDMDVILTTSSDVDVPIDDLG